ncbi:putative cytochrome P450 [Colletotrichum sublineola]|uniref:Putative cytochrome P450 n=1 Tax=Colletotrichum sublineola TaxID=1173701 RepID=A0A066XHB5_COLSU|nr:putative cytochrome P450 [Colletotrichum sublineola]
MGHVELLIDSLLRFALTREKLDLTKWYNMAVFDVIGDLIWGESFYSLCDGRLHAWIPAISLTRLANYKYLEEKINKRLGHGTDRGDFWDRVLTNSSNDENNGDDSKVLSEGMTRGEMLNNASIMVLAGSETSATTLCVQEVRTSFKSTEDITLISVSVLPFLDAVFQETLRLYPPVPTHSQRVPPKGGASVCGKFILENQQISVGISIIGACHNPKNFYRATEFCPERWLKDAPLDFAMDNSNLARAEIRLIMAKILWHFNLKLETDGTGKDWFDQKIWGVWFKKPL